MAQGRHEEINEAGVCLSGLIWQKRRQQYFNGSFRANKTSFCLKQMQKNCIFRVKEQKSEAKQDNNESPPSEHFPLPHWEGQIVGRGSEDLGAPSPAVQPLCNNLTLPEPQCPGYKVEIIIPASQSCCSYDGSL